MTLISNVSGMNGRRGAGGARGVAVEMRALEGNQEDAANPMKIDFPLPLSPSLSLFLFLTWTLASVRPIFMARSSRVKTSG